MKLLGGEFEFIKGVLGVYMLGIMISFLYRFFYLFTVIRLLLFLFRRRGNRFGEINILFVKLGKGELGFEFRFD